MPPKKRKREDKFYAVRNGRTPGIYRSWDETKGLVIGYPGAVFKSFTSLNEAEEFMKESNVKYIIAPTKPVEEEKEEEMASMEPPSTKKTKLEEHKAALLEEHPEIAFIYTDGCCKKNNQKDLSKRSPGYGVYSKELSLEIGEPLPLEHNDILLKPTNNVAELYALFGAMNAVIEKLEKDEMKTYKHVVFRTDSEYTIQATLARIGTATKNSSLIKLIKLAKDQIEKHGVSVGLEWTKGHAGIAGNEMADKLAELGQMKYRVQFNKVN